MFHKSLHYFTQIYDKIMIYKLPKVIKEMKNKIPFLWDYLVKLEQEYELSRNSTYTEILQEYDEYLIQTTQSFYKEICVEFSVQKLRWILNITFALNFCGIVHYVSQANIPLQGVNTDQIWPPLQTSLLGHISMTC